MFMSKVSVSLQMNAVCVEAEQEAEWLTDLMALRNTLPLSKVLEYFA